MHSSERRARDTRAVPSPTTTTAMRVSPIRCVTSALFALAVGACQSSHSTPGVTAAQPLPSAGIAAGGDDAAAAKARADSARYPYTAADVHFMSGMIGHHAQAIVMSRWAPTHGASPSVRTLAERIINAQQDEIVTMQQWLRDRHQPVPDATATGMKMVDGRHGARHAHARHAHRRADEAARRRARPRVRPAVPHVHDPAPQRRGVDGEGPVRHRTAPRRTRSSSSSRPT